MASVVAALALQGAARADEAEAIRHRDVGFEHFASQRWAEGIEEMEKAYAAVPHPDFLFNIAVAYRRWGDRCASAMAAIGRFLVASERGEGLRAGLAELDLLRDVCTYRPIEIRTEPEALEILLDDEGPVMTPIKRSMLVGFHDLATISGTSVEKTRLFVPTSTAVISLVLSQDDPRPYVAFVGEFAPEDQLRVDGRPVRERTVAVRAGRHSADCRGVCRLRAEVHLERGQTATLVAAGVEEEEPRKPQPRVEEPAQDFERSIGWTALQWTSFGVALAGTAAAATFGASASSRRSAALSAEMSVPAPSRDVIDSLRDDADQERTFAFVSTAVVGVALTTFVVSMLVDD